MESALLEEGELLAGDDNAAEAQSEVKDFIGFDLNEAADGVEEDMDCSDDPALAETEVTEKTRGAEDSASVQVSYRKLPRNSRKKLQELLFHWAEWHAAQNFGDSMLEDGSETYYPPLQAGVSVHFWVDKPVSRGAPANESESAQLEVPFYDRACDAVLQSADVILPMDGHLEILEEAARCFNCGSYSHSMKDCQRPRDQNAINSARKSFQHRKGPGAANHRYYENPLGEKFEDIKPGFLRSETRKCLGIGENDPPPWLNRMRELGYPPGYIELEEEASGLVIFGGDQSIPTEDGEILELEPASKSRKLTVDFPGINAPIPENADKRRWSEPHRSSSENRDSYRGSSENRSSRRDEPSLRRSSSGSRRDGFQSLHPDDLLRPPGETSPVRDSRHLSSSRSLRERSGAWAQAQAALEASRGGRGESRSGRW